MRSSRSIRRCRSLVTSSIALRKQNALVSEARRASSWMASTRLPTPTTRSGFRAGSIKPPAGQPGHRPSTNSVMSSPNVRSESPFGLALLAAVGLVACCGLSLLLAAGATVSIAGLGIGSWALVAAGVGVAVFALAWNQRRRRSECVSKESVDAG